MSGQSPEQTDMGRIDFLPRTQAKAMIPEEEYRRHTRIVQEIPVRWIIEGTERAGDGIIRDISVSGILIELDTFFTPAKNVVFALKAVNADDQLFIPDTARLVWARPMKKEMGKYFCGMEFINPPDSIVAQLSKRIEDWFSSIAEAANVNILDNYFHGKGRH